MFWSEQNQVWDYSCQDNKGVVRTSNSWRSFKETSSLSGSFIAPNSLCTQLLGGLKVSIAHWLWSVEMTNPSHLSPPPVLSDQKSDVWGSLKKVEWCIILAAHLSSHVKPDHNIHQHQSWCWRKRSQPPWLPSPRPPEHLTFTWSDILHDQNVILNC